MNENQKSTITLKSGMITHSRSLDFFRHPKLIFMAMHGIDFNHTFLARI